MNTTYRIRSSLRSGFALLGLLTSCNASEQGPASQQLIQVPEPSVTAKKYASLKVIDVHNHDAAQYRYRDALRLWDAYSIDQVVLFSGKISDPEGVAGDAIAWEAHQEHPDRIIPFFTGFDVRNKDSLLYIRQQFEKGFFGIGEYIGENHSSDTQSCSGVWKPNNAMDGFFPEVYALAAEFNAPILLHVDPPFPGLPALQKFEEAMTTSPSTIFIFAHGNAFNTPENVELLLTKHPNLYIDYNPGFNAYDPKTNLPLDAWVPLVEQYHSRFLISTDSGFGIEYYQAEEALYALLDRLSESAREAVAQGNFDQLLDKRRTQAPYGSGR